MFNGDWVGFNLESLLAFKPEELTDDELNQLLEQLESSNDLDLKAVTNDLDVNMTNDLKLTGSDNQATGSS